MFKVKYVDSIMMLVRLDLKLIVSLFQRACQYDLVDLWEFKGSSLVMWCFPDITPVTVDEIN